MKDKPQLSAEMEKRFDEKFKVLKYEQNGEQHEGFGINHVPNAKDVKHFLATALEEQRKEILSEALEMVKHQRLSPKDGYLTDERKRHQNSLRAELRTKLNQLKGSDERR